MTESTTDHCFTKNVQCWNWSGIWFDGKVNKIFYKMYALAILTTMVVIYNLLLIINFIFTPRTVEATIRELTYFCIETTVIVNVLTILLMKKEILEVFDILESDLFQGNDETGKAMVQIAKTYYSIYWKVYCVLCHVSQFLLTCVPVILHLFYDTKLILPISHYYFLSDDYRDKYVYFIYIYQSVGIYVHVIYNVNADTFAPGLMLMAATQFDLLSHKLVNMQSAIDEKDKNTYSIIKEEEDRLLLQQQEVILHYELLLRYCAKIQNILSGLMFTKICMETGIICATLFGLLVSPTSEKGFQGVFLIIMAARSFVPCYMGTQLNYSSEKLVFSAYECEWIPRSQKFKTNMKMLVERANSSIILTGCKILAIDLNTFTGTMKMAYSFFMLLRNIQDRPETNI